jgi:hypothetical protein
MTRSNMQVVLTLENKEGVPSAARVHSFGHRVHTEWQRPLFGVHSIGKISPGRGAKVVISPTKTKTANCHLYFSAINARASLCF